MFNLLMTYLFWGMAARLYDEEFFIQLPSVADSANIPIGKMFYFVNTTTTSMRFNNLDFFPNLGGAGTMTLDIIISHI